MNQAQTTLETSFTAIFVQKVLGFPVFDRIEIPLIQRDYAQGRKGEVVARIRCSFLDALFNAIVPGGQAIDLDFVYGDVEKGAFYPLDGQQRLTTLFLLHWYLACRAGIPLQKQPWTKFTYTTRPGARDFCERLAEFQWPANEVVGEARLSDWLRDHHWFLYTWEHDPTIQSMLVMLDALHERFCGRNDLDYKAVWHRLTDTQQPVISFHLLPIAANGLTDDLYIKMNSRGRPLTIFENFKAHFEDVLKAGQGEDNANRFANKVDTEWSDILWHYRGDDNLIDDVFMRYFRFITEVCAWRSGVLFDEKTLIDDLAEKVYGKGNADAANWFAFLCQAFDTWRQKNIKDEWESLLTATPGETSAKLLLFNAFNGEESPVDLFGACCRLYRESTRWTLGHTLLLYAVLLNRIHNTANFPRQLRVLRNLIEGSSGGEIREQKMPELLADAACVLIDGSLQEVAAFNQEQVANENDKSTLLRRKPELEATVYQLEDQDLLRGYLASFELDPSTVSNSFVKRADAFHALFGSKACWPELTGALLAIGNYSRTQGQRFSDFGSSKNSEPWRELLGGKIAPHLVKALMTLLDEVAVRNQDLACLKTIQQEFLKQRDTSTKMDWRYYFVKYPAMREGASGRYVGILGKPGGYGVCMLEKTRMSSYYRDPYLLAILRRSGVGEAVEDPWFSGYETVPRRMVLKKSGIQIQCVDQGWQITAQPTDPAQKRAFDQVCSKHDIGESGLCIVPQNDSVDTEDRVVLGANVLRDLVGLGL